MGGAFFNGLFCRSNFPFTTASISPRIAIIASQNRSSSGFDSLSVGSIIIVPATGLEWTGIAIGLAMLVLSFAMLIGVNLIQLTLARRG